MAEGLSFTDVNSNELPVAGNSLSRYGSAGRAQAHRLISSASQDALLGDNTTIWFSQLFAGPANNRNAVFIFGTQSIKHTDNPYELSAAGDGFGFTIANIADGVGGNGNGSINAIAYDNSITVTSFVEGTYTPSPTTAVSLIAGKINWKPNGTPDELFLFNVTDLSTEPLEGDAFASITDLDFDQSAFNTVAMYDGTNAITDEIRFGNTFDNVMAALPELVWDNANNTFQWEDLLNWAPDHNQAPTAEFLATIANGNPVELTTGAQAAGELKLTDGGLAIAGGGDLTVIKATTVGSSGALVVNGGLTTAVLNSTGTVTVGAGAGFSAGRGSVASVALAGDATISVTDATLEVASLTGAGGTLTKQGAGTLQIQAADLPAAATALVLSGGGMQIVGDEGEIMDLVRYSRFNGGNTAANLSGIDDGELNGQNGGLFALTPDDSGGWTTAIDYGSSE